MAPNSVRSAVQLGITPNRLQVALALSILKSKPTGITVRDYIFQLRARIKRGKQVIVHDDGHRHLDQVAYWKARADEWEQRCHELEQQNIQLERKHNALTTRPETADLLGNGSKSTKRKGAGPQATRSSKRLRPLSAVPEQDLQLDAPDRFGEGSMSLGLTSGADETEKEGTTLMQNLYVTHKFYRKPDADVQALCSSLIQTTRAIGSLLSTIPRNHERLALRSKDSIGKDKSDLLEVISVSARAFTSALVGLEKIANGPERRLAGLVVFECVQTFKTVLNGISESARFDATARSAAPTRTSDSRTKPMSVRYETGPARTLAQFLNAIISQLNKNDPHHRQIFEGMLFVLTERIGKLLFYCTFDRNRSKTIEGDIRLPPVTRDKSIAAEQEAEGIAIRLEARALVSILERAVAFAPYHMNFALPSTSKRASGSARSPTQKTLPHAAKVPLSVHARDRLQRTLIMCMFGEKERDEFTDVLRLPATLGSMPSIAKVEDKDVGEWFNGEVWRLIGWDILTHEAQW